MEPPTPPRWFCSAGPSHVSLPAYAGVSGLFPVILSVHLSASTGAGSRNLRRTFFFFFFFSSRVIKKDNMVVALARTEPGRRDRRSFVCFRRVGVKIFEICSGFLRRCTFPHLLCGGKPHRLRPLSPFITCPWGAAALQRRLDQTSVLPRVVKVTPSPTRVIKSTFFF